MKHPLNFVKFTWARVLGVDIANPLAYSFSVDDEPSKLWRLALVISLLLFAVTCYFKLPPFRLAVDRQCPWIKEELAKQGIQFPKYPADDRKANGIPEIFYRR